MRGARKRKVNDGSVMMIKIMMLTVTLNLRNALDDMNHLLHLELIYSVFLLHNVQHNNIMWCHTSISLGVKIL
jgi:hypothetical protein